MNLCFNISVLENLFLKNNPITNYKQTWNIDIYEEALLIFLQNGYEPYEKGISLFSGYDDNGQQLMPLVAIKNDFDHSLVRLQKKLLNVNYFLLEKGTRISVRINNYRDVINNLFTRGNIVGKINSSFAIRTKTIRLVTMIIFACLFFRYDCCLLSQP